MSRPPVNPGRVEWSGENPGIYFRDGSGDSYSMVSLFFRVVLSPYGRGSAGLVLACPDAATGWPEAPNFIMTDNQRLMRWLVDGWVRKMPTFRGRPGLDSMTWLHLDSVSKEPGNLKDCYSETLRGNGVTLEMIWKDLGDPLPVEVTAENSATGEHEMYSVFLEAGSAEVRVNGTALPGKIGARTLFGRTISSAFMAFSETWVTPQTRGTES